MGTLVVGECIGVAERQAGREGNTWIETQIVVLDGMRVERVTVANVDKFRGVLPSQGDLVALDCGVRSFGLKAGGTGHAFTAFGRVPLVEDALATSAASQAS